ncbi:DUF1801 domain-containing protein [Massilia arenosa]|uniref:DUF1801 domain-containing protein n=1 Tax=Zemynaea arenosa TaxID=2561931 RepID=A0A4Y9SPI0_9BURK|nr:DUF1801 domain-containing protein [Massilia arenosa]TFW25520.1 DUF1801 domain-containing protein [Massilia arenosa]
MSDVDTYLAGLPADRQAIVNAVREVILANLDSQYAETFAGGMINYVVPHSVYPPGYHCDRSKPLPFAALASQKAYVSLYLMGLYTCEDQKQWFQQAWAASGKKPLDMGKSCLRFKKLDDIALDIIGASFRRLPAQLYIARYEQVLKKK